jgi:hypothetical protein
MLFRHGSIRPKKDSGVALRHVRHDIAVAETGSLTVAG